MDRYRPRLARGLAAAMVSIFLVAGAAFAASAVLSPRSTGMDSGLAASQSQSPTETAENGEDETAEPNETAEPTETAEPAETADSDHSGPGRDGASGTARPDREGSNRGPEAEEPTPTPTATATPTSSASPTATAEPGDDEDEMEPGDTAEPGADDDGLASPTPGATATPSGTPEPTDADQDGADSGHDGDDG